MWYCLVKYYNNIIQFLLKISLIWWDIFSYNFKYIYINKTCFIKKIIIAVEQINTRYNFMSGTPRGKDGARKFFPSYGAGRGWRFHPSIMPLPIVIPNVDLPSQWRKGNSGKENKVRWGKIEVWEWEVAIRHGRLQLGKKINLYT